MADNQTASLCFGPSRLISNYEAYTLLTLCCLVTPGCYDTFFRLDRAATGFALAFSERARGESHWYRARIRTEVG